MIKGKIWLLSLSASLVAWSYTKHKSPALLASLIAAHLPPLIWGIFDIRSNFFCKTLYKAENDSKRLALTFDDGPDPNLTPDVLALLKQHTIRATFFVVGEKAKEQAGLVKQMHEAGHVIACHDLRHTYDLNFRFTKAMTQDIGQAQSIIHSIIGRKPRLYRPPVGLTNPHLAAALKNLDMICIGWSKSTREMGNRLRNKIDKIHTLASAGQVILLHDCLPYSEHKERFLEQLELLCKDIEMKKLKAVSVGELLNVEEYC